MLSVSGCASCAPVEFRAVRQPPSSEPEARTNAEPLHARPAARGGSGEYAAVSGIIFRKIHQPRVVGEMFAGIMLGPSLLGWIAPHFSAYLFPAPQPGISERACQIGVVIFMFLVGLGINPKELKNEGHAAVLTSHVSITAPFVAGGLAVALFVSTLLR